MRSACSLTTPLLRKGEFLATWSSPLTDGSTSLFPVKISAANAEIVLGLWDTTGSKLTANILALKQSMEPRWLIGPNRDSHSITITQQLINRFQSGTMNWRTVNPSIGFSTFPVTTLDLSTQQNSQLPVRPDAQDNAPDWSRKSKTSKQTD